MHCLSLSEILATSILSLSNLLVVWNPESLPLSGDIISREDDTLHKALLKGLLQIRAEGWNALYPKTTKDSSKCLKVNVKTVHCTPESTSSDILFWQNCNDDFSDDKNEIKVIFACSINRCPRKVQEELSRYMSDTSYRHRMNLKAEAIKWSQGLVAEERDEAVQKNKSLRSQQMFEAQGSSTALINTVLIATIDKTNYRSTQANSSPIGTMCPLERHLLKQFQLCIRNPWWNQKEEEASSFISNQYGSSSTGPLPTSEMDPPTFNRGENMSASFECDVSKLLVSRIAERDRQMPLVRTIVPPPYFWSFDVPIKSSSSSSENAERCFSLPTKYAKTATLSGIMTLHVSGAVEKYAREIISALKHHRRYPCVVSPRTLATILLVVRAYAIMKGMKYSTPEFIDTISVYALCHVTHPVKSKKKIQGVLCLDKEVLQIVDGLLAEVIENVDPPV